MITLTRTIEFWDGTDEQLYDVEFHYRDSDTELPELQIVSVHSDDVQIELSKDHTEKLENHIHRHIGLDEYRIHAAEVREENLCQL